MMLYTNSGKGYRINNMEKQPILYSLEHEDDKPKGAGHSERVLDTVGRENLDQNEELRAARAALLGNDAIYKKLFTAIGYRASGSAASFATHYSSVENIFVKYCQNLSDTSIDSIVRQFNIGANEYASKNKGVLSEKILTPEMLKSEKLNASGIKSVVNFIRARKKLLDTDPPTEYQFYVEDELDAKYKIDLIECIYKHDGDRLVVDTMNLIQIKSSEPTDDEQGRILSSHKSWIVSSVMDFDSLKKEYTDGIPEDITIESIARDSEEVETILLDICTDPGGFNPDEFIKRLDLEQLTNKQKAWLLMDYSSIIKDHVRKSHLNGTVTEDQSREIIVALDMLEAKVRSKAKLPKNIAHIANVNSIIAVGAKIVKNTQLIATEEGKKSGKIIKYN